MINKYGIKELLIMCIYIIAMLGTIGCNKLKEEDAGGRDADIETGDGDAGGKDTSTETGNDSGVKCDQDISNDIIWCDPSTGYLWQNKLDSEGRYWQDAVMYCEKMSLGDYNNWVLPTIDQLRALIRECPPTETGGPCEVTDNCTVGGECFNDPCWMGCTGLTGPGIEGCFWDAELSGDCKHYYWSSTEDDNNGAWMVNYDLGVVDHYYKYDGKPPSNRVRCILEN
jgi:hypothetical protein